MGYASERLALWPRLRRAADGRSLTELLRPDARALRFHLGTSLADLTVPVAVDGALTALFARAALDLFYLLCMRHRGALRPAEYDQLLLRDGFDPQVLRPIAYSAPASVTREGIRQTFAEAAELHPALDGGLVASWIAQGRPGRTLLGALNTLFSRAREEGAASEPREPTDYLALLALRAHADGAIEPLRAVPIAPARQLCGAVAAGLLLAMRLAAREAGLSLDDPRIEACLSPLPWLAGGRQLWGSGFAGYGAAFAEAPVQLEPKIARLLAGAAPEQIAREALAELTGSGREIALRAERACALGALRAELFASLKLVEAGRSPLLQFDGMGLAQLFGQPGALERAMGAADKRKELQARAEQKAQSCQHPQARTRMDRIAQAAAEWTDEHPGQGWLSPGDAHKRVSQAIAALAVDLASDRLVEQAESALAHRSGAESEDGLAAEYDRGRLYWFGFGGDPVLARRAGPMQMGHLFCDVKDFTKRTAMLKEAVVADFLQREFYQPILTAAARHHHGAAHLGDKGGLYLNNLLGDAVSFSGDISALVELASDIRAALQAYARRLDGDAHRDVVARSARDIEARVAGRRALLERQAGLASQALARGTVDPESGEEPRTRLRALHQELARLEEEREQELALVRGEKLDAGIFISYGAAPEVATFEDHVFGSIKVAIAEKINESARGTARNGGVRARVESALAAARLQKQAPDLPCPLQVFLAQPLSIPISSEQESRVHSALDHGDLDAAEMALRESVHAFVQRLSNDGPNAGGGDIYNGGAALSEEALAAYLAARANEELVVLHRELTVFAMHPELTDRLVFPQQQLSLVMLIDRESGGLVELFVYSGRALFRGLEKSGGMGVYEMVPRGSLFFTLLAQHHLPAWLAESMSAASRSSGS